MIQVAESVAEGHPDKVADFIADSLLDAYLGQDPFARVACEVLCKNDTVILAGEVTSKAQIDHEAIVRKAIREIGYTDLDDPFNTYTARIVEIMSRQGDEIRLGVDCGGSDLGAGDQGIMIGYATDETPELMPLPILLAHRLTRRFAWDRKERTVPWLRPDGKVQVAMACEDGESPHAVDVVVSLQHFAEASPEQIVRHVETEVLPDVLGPWLIPSTCVHVNPAGSFIHGGPGVDCGLTGRKNIVDSYGPAIPHGGGSFSGKDPTKVDRSAAYFCRYVACHAVRNGLARRLLVRVAYAIGESRPVVLDVDTFGTGNREAALRFVRRFDFRPAAIIEQLGLRNPIYRATTNYGHFGRPELPWEPV